MRILSIFILLSFYFLTGFAQVQIGFHYNIKNSRGSFGDINYTIRDTARDDDNNITSVKINNYLTGLKTATSSTDRTNHYQVITTNYPGLKMCTTKLKAALIQKDKDESGKIYIVFWGIKHELDYCEHDEDINKGLQLGEFYYQVPVNKTLGDITRSITVNFATTEVGIATIPFKYRIRYIKDTVFVPNDASSNINLGLYLGRKWGKTKFFTDPAKTKTSIAVLAGCFVAPTIITLSQSNAFATDNIIISKQLQNQTNQLGVSSGLMLAYCFNNFIVGGFLGVDLGINSLSQQWYYSGKPWFGIGFGYKLSMLGEK